MSDAKPHDCGYVGCPAAEVAALRQERDALRARIDAAHKELAEARGAGLLLVFEDGMWRWRAKDQAAPS